jgi:hypothetical protein
MSRALQTRGVFAIDCRRRGDRLWVGLLLLDGDQTGPRTLVDRETGATLSVVLPPNLDPISYQVELAIDDHALPAV